MKNVINRIMDYLNYDSSSNKPKPSLPELPAQTSFRLEYNFSNHVARYLIDFDKGLWVHVDTKEKTIVPVKSNDTGEFREIYRKYSYTTVEEIERRLKETFHMTIANLL